MRPSLACALALLLLAGCDDAKPGGSDELTIVVKGDRRELELQEQALQEREGQLRRDKAALDSQLDELKKGLKTLSSDAEQRRRFDEQLARAQELQKQTALELDTVAAKKSEVGLRKAAIDPPAGEAGQAQQQAREAALTTREAKAAERDEGVSRREREVAARELQLAQREKELADKLLASGGAQPAGKGALRELPQLKELEARHKKVLESLAARGVLVSDLPVEDQPLNAEIHAARAQGDAARAADLLKELERAAKAVRLDQRFVEGKMQRLQAQRSRAQLSAERKQEVERLLSEVTSAFSDGRYEQANAALNRIAKLLD
jgi:hypothetical protein